jgi:type IV secretion system protein TrbL
METLIDHVVGAFLSALVTGTSALIVPGIAGLGTLAAIAYGMRQWPTVMSSGAGVGDVLAGFLGIMLGLGVTLWLVTNLVAIGQGLYDTGVTLGLSASGAGVSPGQLRNPSFILAMHKIVTKPLEHFILAHTGWAAMWNGPTLVSFWLAELVIYAVFVGVALNVALIQIELYLAVLAAAVLLPLSAIQPSAFVAEFVVGWVIGCTLRTLLITTIAGIAVPLFAGLAVGPAGADPTWVEALGVVAGSVLFGVVAWQVPSKAGNIVGYGIGLTVSTVAGTAAGAAGLLLRLQGALQAASRVVSPLLQRR